jgi:hypothetical protein
MAKDGIRWQSMKILQLRALMPGNACRIPFGGPATTHFGHIFPEGSELGAPCAQHRAPISCAHSIRIRSPAVGGNHFRGRWQLVRNAGVQDNLQVLFVPIFGERLYQRRNGLRGGEKLSGSLRSPYRISNSLFRFTKSDSNFVIAATSPIVMNVSSAGIRS